MVAENDGEKVAARCHGVKQYVRCLSTNDCSLDMSCKCIHCCFVRHSWLGRNLWKRRCWLAESILYTQQARCTSVCAALRLGAEELSKGRHCRVVEWPGAAQSESTRLSHVRLCVFDPDGVSRSLSGVNVSELVFLRQSVPLGDAKARFGTGFPMHWSDGSIH